jgi:hypothetical protein
MFAVCGVFTIYTPKGERSCHKEKEKKENRKKNTES